MEQPTTDSIIDGANGAPSNPSLPHRPAPSSACPKCGERSWYWNRSGDHGSWRCKPCFNTYKQNWTRSHSIDPKRCPDCGKALPHGGKCPETLRRNFIARGRRLLNEQWPEYGSALTDEVVLARAGKDFPHVRYPLPSLVFPGLDPSVDQRLVHEKRDKDVALCRELATILKSDQREFLELFLVDPMDARRWAILPGWQRPLRKGDPDDVLIWKFFTIYRLNMEHAARGTQPWPMSSQGAHLGQLFGTLYRLTPEGVKRLCLVMNTFGAMLKNHQDVGDLVKKPF